MDQGRVGCTPTRPWPNVPRHGKSLYKPNWFCQFCGFETADPRHPVIPQVWGGPNIFSGGFWMSRGRDRDLLNSPIKNGGVAIFPSKIQWDLTNGPPGKLLELLDTPLKHHKIQVDEFHSSLKGDNPILREARRKVSAKSC